MNVRTRKWAPALLLATAGALVLAGVAGAANSATFTDPAGDSTLAPDITQLAVSNDDSGTLTFRVTFGAGGLTPGLPLEHLGVALDLDQNPDTGTVYYGTEVELALDFGPSGASTLEFYRAAGNSFAEAPPPPSLTGALSGSTLTFTVKDADLGLAPTAGFNVFAISETPLDGDLAPGIRAFNYQQVAGTPPPPLGADARAPVDHAFRSRGVHGKVARLDYTAQDGRAVTADTLRVYRKSRLLKTIRIGLGDANPLYEYDARWRVPKKLHGKLRFCVSSVDAAGNRSNSSCAPLVIR